MDRLGLRALSLFFGVVYLLTQQWQPYPSSVLIKGLGVGLLAVLAFRQGSPILGIALSFSALGDVLLDIDPGLFVFGLGSFLIAHLVYTSLWIRNRPRPFTIRRAQAIPAILVLLYSVSVCTWLLPSLGSLIVPVAIYMCAITAMVVTSILARFSQRTIVLGTVLFLISDSILAVNKFKTPIPYRDVLVWSTYYAGQYFIGTGFLSTLESK